VTYTPPQICHPSELMCAWPLGCYRIAAVYDHDHATDRVRAPLCRHHNAVLRSAGDTSASLRAVAVWLDNADMGFTYTDAERFLNRMRGRAKYAADPEKFRAAGRLRYATNAIYREQAILRARAQRNISDAKVRS